MRTVRPVLSAFLIVAAVAPCAGAAFELDTTRRGKAVEIVANAEIRADPEHAWSTLTAYERYVDFIPDMTVSRVVERTGDSVVLDLVGAMRVLWWHEPLEVRLAVTETPRRRVHSQLISGTLEAMEGEYELTATPGGVRLTYTGRIVPDPRQRGLLDRFIIRLNASRQFGALIAEIERAARSSAGPAGGRWQAPTDELPAPRI